MPAMSNQIQTRLWRLFGFVSAVVGLLCYALSSSFNHLFGHWNLLKIFLYLTFSFTILFITWFGKVWPFSTTTPSIMFKTHIPILVLLATSVYSLFYDKAVNTKPDAYILISCAAFSVTCLCLSKQTQLGCEVDLLNFFLGFLILLLMKINLWLFFVGAAFSYSLLIIRSCSCSDTTLQSEYFELFQNHLAIPENYLLQLLEPQHANSDSATELYLEQANEMHRFIQNVNYAQGTDAVESISLDLTQIADLPLASYDAFRNMRNRWLLAFFRDSNLRNNNPAIISRLVELPSMSILRYLQWDRILFTKLLPSISFEKLLYLSMSHRNLQKLWDGAQNMPYLKKFGLAFSEFLIECPDLTGAPNLESISFLGCESLHHLLPSIFSVQELQELDQSRCTKLNRFCSKSCSPSRRLHVVRCANLQEWSFKTLGDQRKTHLHMKFE